MADLFGLSPEEINRVADQRIDTSKMAIGALGGASAYNYNQAQAHKIMNPDLVDLNFNGTNFRVRREDVPQAISSGARWLEATEKVPMNLGGQTFMIRGGDIAEAVRAGATLQELPSKIAANEARAGASNASAVSSYSTADLNAQKQRDLLEKQRSLEALRGVGAEDVTKPGVFGDVARVNPSALSTATTRNLTPPPAQKDPMAMTAALIQKAQKDNAELNSAYVKDKSPYIAVVNKDGINVKVALPKTVNGQLTAKKVIADAAARGITPTQWYEEFQRQVKGN